MSKNVYRVEVLLGCDGDDSKYFQAWLDFNKISVWWIPVIEDGEEPCVNIVVDGALFTYRQDGRLTKLLKGFHYE